MLYEYIQIKGCGATIEFNNTYITRNNQDIASLFYNIAFILLYIFVYHSETISFHFFKNNFVKKKSRFSRMGP